MQGILPKKHLAFLKEHSYPFKSLHLANQIMNQLLLRALPILFCFFLITVTEAQQTQNLSNSKSLFVRSRPMPDSIMLRWAPSDAKTWRLANIYGYQLKRYTVVRDDKIPKQIDEVLLTEKVLKPAPVEIWEPFIDDKYVGVAAECIYSSFYKGVPTGGNPHIAYKKYKEEQQRFSFALYAADQSLQAAELSGLYFADKTAKSNEKYLYKVYINCPDSLAKDTASVFTGQSAYKALSKPIDLEANWQDHKVSLTWNIKFLKHIYNSYIVEKSTDEGKIYQQLGDNAIVQVSDEGVDPYFMSKNDSLPDNRTRFYYRVRGINAFGQMGPPSDSVFGTGRLPIDKAPVIISNELINNEKIDLQWEYPEEMNDYIEGFKLYRSSSPKGKKKLVFEGKEAAQRAFMDTTPNMTNYYRISVYKDKVEKLSPLTTYAARVDSFPPAQPEGGYGVIDSTGIVTLKWKPNTEEDINGYRVYRSNHLDYEFMLVGTSIVKDTVFKDTINIKTLTKKVYYKVRAEDIRQNQSSFSEVIAIKRPDIIPPESPLLKSIKNQEDKPLLTWVNSFSEDVVNHYVFRRNQSDSTYTIIASLVKGESSVMSYEDKTVEKGNTYVYRIVAEDDSGLLSQPSKTIQFIVDSGIEEQLRLKRRVLADRVKLTWSIQSEKEVKRMIIYRAVDGGALKLYDHSEQETYFDAQLSPGKTYKYAIKAIYKDDSSSQLSKTVVVKF